MPGMPAPVADEREGLLAFLQQQRDAVRISAYGLTDEQAGTAASVSALTIGGLIKHLADMEVVAIGARATAESLASLTTQPYAPRFRPLLPANYNPGATASVNESRVAGRACRCSRREEWVGIAAHKAERSSAASAPP